MNRYCLVGLAILLTSSGSGRLAPVHAATATSSLAISATVEATCSFASHPLPASDHSAASINGNITRGINCSRGTYFSAGLEDPRSAVGSAVALIGAGSGDVFLSHDGHRDIVTETITF